MRIIRFVADDGRILCGEDRRDGTATVVRDLVGVLGAGAVSARLGRLRGCKAIVADDDENMRRLVTTVLERAGCSCVPCPDGAAALRALDAEQVDLVVSDIMMPHHNGYEIFSAAKAHRADLPVLLITGFGYDPSHSLMRASQEGLRSVLYKPFTPQQLLEQLLRAMEPAHAGVDGLLERTDETATISSMLAPVRPSNLVCVGSNWRRPGDDVPDDATDTLEVFMKPVSAVTAVGEPVRVPEIGSGDPCLAAEGELAVIIGRTAERIDVDEALDHVLGYTIANDITARRFQTAAGPPRWMRGKGFDTFCPLGPALVTPDELGDVGDVEIVTEVNGRVVRRGSTADMIRPVPRLISELSRGLTLEPGTVILTGAPPLVEGAPDEPLRPGDVVAIEIPALGRLVNPIGG